MPGNWTPEKKAAQSKKLKQYWARRKEEERKMKRVLEVKTPTVNNVGFFRSVMNLVKGDKNND